MADGLLFSATLEASVRVENLPAHRSIVAVELQADGVWRICGAGSSDAYGLAALEIQAQRDSSVYAMAVDAWGAGWQPALSVAVGDTVRPPVFTGWLYRVTQAGVLAEFEPAWWDASAVGPQPVGTAMLEAVRYYQPIVHGPVALDFKDAVGDQYWASVVSLLQFDGADGSTTVVDGKGLTWVIAGAAQIDTAYSMFGGASLLKSTDADYLRLPPNVGLNFGTGDFTLEFYHRRTALSESTVLGSGQSAYGPGCVTLFFNTTYPGATPGALTFVLQADSYALLHSDSYTPGVGVFAHIAITRQAGVLRMFIDGNLTGTVSSSVPIDLSAGTGTFLGRSGWSATGSNGHYDGFRVTKGVARYTASFAAPTEAFPAG